MYTADKQLDMTRERSHSQILQKKQDKLITNHSVILMKDEKLR